MTGEGLSFAAPSAFWALWLLPAFAGAYVLSAYLRSRALFSFAGSRRQSELVEGHSRSMTLAGATLVVLAAALLVFALARPRWGYTLAKTQPKNVDIILVIDTSRSMLADDCPGNTTRIEWVKRKAADLIAMLRGERIGILVFAGETFVQCPLTEDYTAALMLLEDVDTTSVPFGGSDVGLAIERAVNMFPDTSAERVLLLLTDGEDHSARALDAAVRAHKEKNVTVYCIGIGTLDGVDLEAPSETGALAYVKDSGGRVVHSRLNDTALQEMALRTGGAYVSTTAGQVDLREIYANRIARIMHSGDTPTGFERIPVERYRWMLVPAFLLLVAESVAPAVVSRRKRSRREAAG